MASSFRDTFTKEEKKDPLLDYDDTAFYFFATTLLIVAAIPLTWSTLSTLKGMLSKPSKTKRTHQPKDKEGGGVPQDCKCSFCVNKEDKQLDADIKKRFANFGTYLKIFCTVLVWILFWLAFERTQVDTQIKVFDPFEILQLSSGSTEADIKKAYRRLSLLYHPDKNVNDPMAASRFIAVSKAYQVLTDETARKNYEKYGNPDGPQVMKVAIGLPRFLLEEGNHVVILSAFFFFLLVVIPAIVLIWYSQWRGYAQNGLLFETMGFIMRECQEHMLHKNFPELLSLSAEARAPAIRGSDNKDVEDLLKRHGDLMAKPKYYDPKKMLNAQQFKALKMNLLLHSYLLGDKLNPGLQEDLDTFLRSVPKMLEATIELILIKGQRRWLRSALNVVEFSQRVVQGLWIASSPFLQLPHMDEDTVRRHIKSGKNSVHALPEYITSEEKKGLRDFSEQQVLDVSAVCQHLPRMAVSASFFVEDEEEIAEGDIITLSLKFNRQNLQEGEEAGPVHAPRFPYTKYEEWWIFIADEQRDAIISITRTKNQAKNFEESVKFPPLGAGRYTFDVIIKCDSYIGLDIQQSVTLIVKPQSQVQRQVYVHPEDEALDHEPSLFQQLLGTDGHDSDEEEEEEPRVPEEEEEQEAEAEAAAPAN
eukprot:GILI01012399.1.p1 GENE.GILI01012399.1~~GILI01012399.1.p1  ORF type:complete len:646 (-),score=242.57 GILI01012399.1:204-2141(-)